MTWSFLDAGLGWPVAGALLVVSLFSSFITAAFGIGGGTVMLTVMALVLRLIWSGGSGLWSAAG